MTSDEEKICLQEMTIRIELPCTHVISMSCIKNLIETTGSYDRWPCPNCSRMFSLTAVPADSLNPSEYVRKKWTNKSAEYHRAGVIQDEGKVMGMTVIGDDLFIVRSSPPNVIFKYDIGANNAAPGPPVEMCISKMKYPRGIAASETSSCLYITDWHKKFGGRLWRYKYQKGQETVQEDPVDTLDVQPFGVSVSQETDQLLVTCATPVNIFVKRGWIYIYKPSGSKFPMIRKIELPGLEIPRHSILTPSSHLIVCHGWYAAQSHGVTSYSYDGKDNIIKKSLFGIGKEGGSGEMEMNRPRSMIQDKDGHVLLVDGHNHRIQLLTENLQFVSYLINSGITYPRHICQDSNSGRIYVGQQDGTVQIFDALIVTE